MIVNGMGNVLAVSIEGDPCAAVEDLRAKGINENTGYAPMRDAFLSAQAACTTARAAAPSTPLFGPAPTLNMRRGLTGGFDPNADPAAACRGLQARVEKYGALDPIPAVRKALIEKCEAYQRSRSAVAAVSPDEYPAAHGLGGLDMKTKIAIGVGALVVGAIVVKKLKKR